MNTFFRPHQRLERGVLHPSLGVQPHLWMVRSQNQPATEQESNVKNAGADDEAYDGGEREAEGDEEHVVFVQVAEEAEEPAPLAKHCQAYHNAGVVH